MSRDSDLVVQGGQGSSQGVDNGRTLVLLVNAEEGFFTQSEHTEILFNADIFDLLKILITEVDKLAVVAVGDVSDGRLSLNHASSSVGTIEYNLAKWLGEVDAQNGVNKNRFEFVGISKDLTQEAILNHVYHDLYPSAEVVFGALDVEKNPVFDTHCALKRFTQNHLDRLSQLILSYKLSPPEVISRIFRAKVPQNMLFSQAELNELKNFLRGFYIEGGKALLEQLHENQVFYSYVLNEDEKTSLIQQMKEARQHSRPFHFFFDIDDTLFLRGLSYATKSTIINPQVVRFFKELEKENLLGCVQLHVLTARKRSAEFRYTFDGTLAVVDKLNQKIKQVFPVQRHLQITDDHVCSIGDASSYVAHISDGLAAEKWRFLYEFAEEQPNANVVLFDDSYVEISCVRGVHHYSKPDERISELLVDAAVANRISTLRVETHSSPSLFDYQTVTEMVRLAHEMTITDYFFQRKIKQQRAKHAGSLDGSPCFFSGNGRVTCRQHEVDDRDAKEKREFEYLSAEFY